MTNPPAATDKVALLRAVLGELRRRVAELTGSQRAIHAGTVHEESRAEGPKDTRAIESSYLARGLALRVSELRVAVAALEILELRRFDGETPIGVSALVTLADEEGASRQVFLAPAGGGVRVGAVQVVTPTAPLGRALVGARVGDAVVVQTPGGAQELEIVDVM